MGIVHAFIFICLVNFCFAINCDEYEDCALGALRNAIVNHKGSNKNHSLTRAMLRYKEHPECTENNEVLSTRDRSFPNHVSIHGPQCESRFSFTTAEGFLGHVALILNVALATVWYSVHVEKKKELKMNESSQEEKESLLS